MKQKELLNKYLVDNNLRQTPERYIILKYIYQTSRHFDIDFLYNCINKKEKISKATIYNNLEILSKAKLIKKSSFNDSKILYEKSLNKKQHDHLICNTCGEIFEFCDPRIKNILDGIEKMTNFQVQSHSLNVYGQCKDKKCNI
ncbi:MAG: transcriptional repressor [Flavobacteriales bacterium]|nr:transcriptional repressor [Flavobacteriales bacterium]|tara:strand:- start:746 stop:1174 length:429 start_codon:yes stop_codon:yes gene_type:complete